MQEIPHMTLIRLSCFYPLHDINASGLFKKDAKFFDNSNIDAKRLLRISRSLPSIPSAGLDRDVMRQILTSPSLCFTFMLQ